MGSKKPAEYWSDSAKKRKGSYKKKNRETQAQFVLELEAENQRLEEELAQKEDIAEQAGMIQAIHTMRAQGQHQEHGSTHADVYVGTVQSFDEAIEAHRRLPPHLRIASLTALHASDVVFFAFGIPRRGMERAVEHLGLRRSRQCHELKLDVLQTAVAPGSDNAGVNVSGR